MRNRIPDSTTPIPPPSEEPFDADDFWVYLVTEKGLRLSGAAGMHAAASDLKKIAADLENGAKVLSQEVDSRPRQAAETPACTFRRGTISGRYGKDTAKVPYLRLSGHWLRRAGFELGQKFQVRVDVGRLTICAE